MILNFATPRLPMKWIRASVDLIQRHWGAQTIVSQQPHGESLARLCRSSTPYVKPISYSVGIRFAVSKFPVAVNCTHQRDLERLI